MEQRSKARARSLRGKARALDERYLGGRARDWWLRHGVLGGRWGEFLDELDAIPADAVVLDHGAGEATLRGRLPGRRYFALDMGVGHGGWDYSALDVVGDVMRLPLRDRSVDVVVSKQVLEHVPEPVATLREIARVLRPGGRVLLSTNQAWPQHQQPHDFFRFTLYGLRHCFSSAGLDVDRMEPMGGAFTAAMFHASQTLAPHLYARSAAARRVVGMLLKPFGWLLKALTPVVSWLDRLDRTKDNTLGWYVVASRAERPRVCAAILRGDDVLMVRHEHLSGAAYWTLPGGGVHEGETLEDAVLREVREETGLYGTVVRPLYEGRYRYGPEHCFLVSVAEDEQPRLGHDPEEIGQPHQILTAVSWKPISSVADDHHVARVIEALRGRQRQ